MLTTSPRPRSRSVPTVTITDDVWGHHPGPPASAWTPIPPGVRPLADLFTARHRHHPRPPAKSEGGPPTRADFPMPAATLAVAVADIAKAKLPGATAADRARARMWTQTNTTCETVDAELIVVSPSKPSKVKGKNIDARMLKRLADAPAAVSGWSAREWAEYLNCSAGTVKETKTWRTHLAKLKLAEKLGRAERRDDAGGRGASRRRSDD